MGYMSYMQVRLGGKVLRFGYDGICEMYRLANCGAGVMHILLCV